MQHERGVLTEITEARANAMKARRINRKISAETRLSTALEGLKVAVEAYPDLKASQNFLDLQNEISDIENKIGSTPFLQLGYQRAQRCSRSFPVKPCCHIFNFKREPMFDLADQRTTVEAPPKIQF